MQNKMRNQKSKVEVSLSDFINNTLVKELKQIIAVAPYLSFSCISCCIENLGAYLDPNPLDERELSKKRFVYAIEQLFPSNYKTHASRLYRGLRCPIVHRAQPEGVVVSHAGNEDKHLKMENNNLMVALKPFSEDFFTACTELIKKINQKASEGDVKALTFSSYIIIQNNWGLGSKKEPTIFLSSLTGSVNS